MTATNLSGVNEWGHWLQFHGGGLDSPRASLLRHWGHCDALAKARGGVRRLRDRLFDLALAARRWCRGGRGVRSGWRRSRDSGKTPRAVGGSLSVGQVTYLPRHPRPPGNGLVGRVYRWLPGEEVDPHAATVCSRPRRRLPAATVPDSHGGVTMKAWGVSGDPGGVTGRGVGGLLALETFSLAETPKAGDCLRVQLDMKLSGDMRIQHATASSSPCPRRRRRPHADLWIRVLQVIRGRCAVQTGPRRVLRHRQGRHHRQQGSLQELHHCERIAVVVGRSALNEQTVVYWLHHRPPRRGGELDLTSGHFDTLAAVIRCCAIGQWLSAIPGRSPTPSLRRCAVSRV